MPTVHRLDCGAHQRFGQISRSGVRPSAGGSGPFATFATGSLSFSSTFSCGKCSAEVVRLQNIVSQLQAQLAKSEAGVAEMVMDGVQESPLKKGRVRSRCRKWQCPRSQQVGFHVGRGCFTAEELDHEPSMASNTVG